MLPFSFVEEFGPDGLHASADVEHDVAHGADHHDLDGARVLATTYAGEKKRNERKQGYGRDGRGKLDERRCDGKQGPWSERQSECQSGYGCGKYRLYKRRLLKRVEHDGLWSVFCRAARRHRVVEFRRPCHERTPYGEVDV